MQPDKSELIHEQVAMRAEANRATLRIRAILWESGSSADALNESDKLAAALRRLVKVDAALTGERQ